MAAAQVRVVQTRAEFDAAMDCQWAGFAEPVEDFWTVWFPVDLGAHLGRPARRPDAVSESKNRLWSEHLADPYSTWIYIAEDSQRTSDAAPDCVASCQWRIYEEPTNPFPDGMPDLQCAAWPGTSNGAKFTAKLARGIFTPRVTRFARPHIGLSWMAVRPDARQRGLGSMLMQWGLDRADQLGLEGYIEGSDLGKILYEKHAFREIREFWVDISPTDDSDAAEWDALTRYYLPRGFHGHAMWRPARGAWENVNDESWKEGFDFWSQASP